MSALIAALPAALLTISGGSPGTIGATPVLELDHVYIVVPPGGAAAAQALRQIGLVIDSSVNRHVGQGTASMAAFFEFEDATSADLVLEFDGGQRGQVLDLRPVLPLILHY